MKWSWISRAFLREQKKWDTNFEPRSEVMWERTPCLEKTWSRNSFANSGDVIMLCVRVNRHCLKRQSMTTSMKVNPEDRESCLMKSMEMEFHGFLGMGSYFSNLYDLCLGTIVWMQDVQDEM